MIHKEFRWKTKDNIELYGQYWSPDDKPKAVLCLIHGMGEHSSRYVHLAAYLVSEQYATLTFDQRGHGKSGGKRGHTTSYNALLDGIDELLRKAKEEFLNLPLFLFGHSMGGNLVLNYGLRRKPSVRGIIASSPWLKLAFQPPALQVKIAKLVNSFWPSFTQSTRLDKSAVSRDKTVVEAYSCDPLVHDYISSNMFLSIHEAGLWALENASSFPVPLLLYHGSGDKITSHKASQEFVSKIKNGYTFRIWDGFYHESHNEPEKSEVFSFLTSWLNKHL